MDIKLKNRHRFSALLSILLVAGAAVVMVGLYPYFEKVSREFDRPVYEDQAFLRHLIYGNYVLDLEWAQYDAGGPVSPFDHFIPQAAEEFESMSREMAPGHGDYEIEVETHPAAGEAAVEEGVEAVVVTDIDISSRMEYLREIRRSTIREYENWRRYYNSIRKSIDYQVLDQAGNIVLSNIGNGRRMENDDIYVFKAVLHYDELGRMDVMQVSGENGPYIQELLQRFGDRDPLEDYYWDDYQYENELRIQNPRNKTFIYGMTAEQISVYQEDRNESWDSYFNSGRVIAVFLGMFAAVAVLAFFFSCFDVTRADDSKIFRAPAELVLIIAWAGILFGYYLTSLVAVTNQNQLYNGLLKANFLPVTARVMEVFWNIMWWCVPFAIAYWSVICVRDVFHIGFKRYLRERTVIGWFCGWCARMCGRAYAFLESIDLQDKSDRTIFKIVGINFIILTVLCSMWFFGIGALIVYSVVLFIILRKYYRDLSVKYRILLQATGQIAEGNLDVNITEDLGVFEPFKTEVQKIQSGFKVAVDQEVKSQKMKTDLITNMSHDLKTPLTAIITYVNLMKEDNITPEQHRAYVDVLEQKSMRLKSLIEDLFEISKANSNNVTLNLENVDIVSLLKEVSLELGDKIEESTIDFRWNLPEEKIVLPLDGQKTYRIFDNLLSNIIKYAMPHTRAYIDMKKEDGWVSITMKNVSASELTFNPDEITERFVRGDQARNTEGSGLGMAIAKSFVELQNGRMTVETEADLFRVIIRWPVEEA